MSRLTEATAIKPLSVGESADQIHETRHVTQRSADSLTSTLSDSGYLQRETSPER
jgi:hypothetical protein